MTAAQRTRSGAAQPSEQVRTYLTALSPDARQHLEKLRATIRAAAPAAVESFSYGIPAFRLDGKGLVLCLIRTPVCRCHGPQAHPGIAIPDLDTFRAEALYGLSLRTVGGEVCGSDDIYQPLPADNHRRISK